MNLKRAVILVVSLIAVSLLTSGCATMGVQVWERDILSKPEMQLDSQAIDRAIVPRHARHEEEWRLFLPPVGFTGGIEGGRLLQSPLTDAHQVW